ncbi:maleylpyruvate isomerase family mycothiol-dependent enzyme [Jatrophihabitans sp. DSM 45814]
MDADEYVKQLERDAALFVRAAQFAGLDAVVPSCPRWQVLALMQHLTRVHHWATLILGGGDQAAFEFERPTADEVYAVFATGVAGLTSSLREAPDDLDVWTFAGDKVPKMFWARRMAHETAIHRVDAELAAGMGVTEFDADFAADGIDELMLTMAPGRISTKDVPRAFTATLTPLDSNASWTISVRAGDSAGSYAAMPGARDDSDLSVFGLASDLYRWAWNRAGDDEISLRGDVALADVWRETLVVGSR